VHDLGEIRRLRTGIKGLDDAITGLVPGRTYLLTGDAGTGKTIFGLQFAVESARSGLRTVYISTEEEKGDLTRQAQAFGWDVESYEQKDLWAFIEFVGPRLMDLESSVSMNIDPQKGDFERLVDTVPKGVDVVVIDSLGSHTSNLSPREFKDRMDLLVYQLNGKGITTLLVLDSATSKEHNDLALFSVYGVFVLMKRENPYTGRRERAMDIVKMRNTRTPLQLLTFSIEAEKGISIDDKDRIIIGE
jgi:KaiC/GvpD/RAD55 family RecA-like ATPase